MILVVFPGRLWEDANVNITGHQDMGLPLAEPSKWPEEVERVLRAQPLSPLRRPSFRPLPVRTTEPPTPKREHEPAVA